MGEPGHENILAAGKDGPAEEAVNEDQPKVNHNHPKRSGRKVHQRKEDRDEHNLQRRPDKPAQAFLVKAAVDDFFAQGSQH